MTLPQTLHLDIQGQGASILLLHGFAGSARNWRNLTRTLNTDYQTICYDLPGHARSQAPTNLNTYTLPAQLKLIDELLTAHAKLPAVIGGLSMGAGLAFHYALHAPQNVRGLILAAFPSGSRYEGGIQKHTALFADAIDQQGLEKAGAQFVWHPQSGFTPKDVALIRLGFLEHSPHGLSASLRYLLGQYPEGDALIQLAKNIQVPTLLLAGSLDQPAVEISQTLAQHIPQAQLEIIEGGGHLINIDSAKIFNAKIVDFLNAL